MFKGWVDEITFASARFGTGMVIAIKKLNQEGSRATNKFVAEIYESLLVYTLKTNLLLKFPNPHVITKYMFLTSDVRAE
ncbi:Protein kinase APK1A, chloroplastic [Hordeum vulgare]|nr:Protein kinase APK1A, chloroplastic [Hordeum vulgare]